MGVPHGEAGKTMPIDVKEQGHPPGQREITMKEPGGSMAGSGQGPNRPKS